MDPVDDGLYRGERGRYRRLCRGPAYQTPSASAGATLAQRATSAVSTCRGGDATTHDVLRWLTPLRIGLVAGVVFALLRISGQTGLEWIAARAIDNRLASRGVVQPGPEVVIVAVDDLSLETLGRWPWSRARIAELVDRIAAAGAAVIGFDMVQSEPSTDDHILAASLAGAGRVALGYFFDFAQQDPESLQRRFSTYSAIRNQPADDRNVRVPRGTSIRGNLAQLTEAAREIGYFNFIPDADGSYRRVPLAIRVGDRFAIPLSVAMLHLYRPEWNLGLTFRGALLESATIGPVTVPLAEDGQMLINYRGPGRTFPHLAASDVLSGIVSGESLRDKIVLVGVTATAVADVRVAPFDGLMPGVEIHANIIDSILRQDLLWSSATEALLIEGVVVLILCALLGLALTYARGLLGALAAAAFIAAFHYAGQAFFEATGICLSTLFPALAIGLTYGAVSVQHYVVEERSKRHLRNALEHYVPPAVARQLSNDPELLALEGQTRELTVMFLDIRGFTPISEQLRDEPHELVALLNTFIDAMTEVILENDGTVDKYVGDEIMAFWGAPLPQRDHAQRACHAALRLLRRLDALNREIAARGWPKLDIGIGLNSGPMVVGNMGSRRRFCYTVVGDNVNLGARLEGLNRVYGTHILATAATASASDVRSREIDVVRVKGKREAVRLFEILETAGSIEETTSRDDAFRRALGLYRSRQWNEAREAWQAILAECPDDGPARLYLSRIASFEQTPPPSDWDGVTVMDSK